MLRYKNSVSTIVHKVNPHYSYGVPKIMSKNKCIVYIGYSESPFADISYSLYFVFHFAFSFA